MRARAAVWAENWVVVSCRWWVKVRGLVWLKKVARWLRNCDVELIQG
jgi:hypothetical protein